MQIAKHSSVLFRKHSLCKTDSFLVTFVSNSIRHVLCVMSVCRWMGQKSIRSLKSSLAAGVQSRTSGLSLSCHRRWQWKGTKQHCLQWHSNATDPATKHQSSRTLQFVSRHYKQSNYWYIWAAENLQLKKCICWVCSWSLIDDRMAGLHQSPSD